MSRQVPIRPILLPLLAIASLLSLVTPALAQQVLPPSKPGCIAVVRFVNSRDGGFDSRFGVRLDVEGNAYAILPSDAKGEVRFYIAESVPVPFSVVPLYLGDLYMNQDFNTPGVGPGDQQANCGFQVITTPGRGVTLVDAAAYRRESSVA